MIWAAIYILGAAAFYWVALGVINVEARYRKGAALGIAVFWPGLIALLAAFLLLDLFEWVLRRTRRWLAGAWS